MAGYECLWRLIVGKSALSRGKSLWPKEAKLCNAHKSFERYCRTFQFNGLSHAYRSRKSGNNRLSTLWGVILVWAKQQRKLTDRGMRLIHLLVRDEDFFKVNTVFLLNFWWIAHVAETFTRTVSPRNCRSNRSSRSVPLRSNFNSTSEWWFHQLFWDKLSNRI